MPAKLTPHYAVSYGYALGEGPWDAGFNTWANVFDTLMGCSAISDALTTPPPGASAIWDATHMSVGVTLSNGNLTAATTAGTKGVVGNTPLNGKVYFEYKLTAGAISGNQLIGIAPQNVDLTRIIGYTTPDAAGAQTSGIKWYYNSAGGAGSGGGPGGNLAVNGFICIAYDSNTRKVWFRVGAAGLWNNASTATQDPANNIGGFILTGTQAIYPAFTSDLATTYTINFGSQTLGGAIPVGFLSVDAANVAVSGDTYIVAASPTGAWAGKAGQIARWTNDNAWLFVPPVRGLRVEVRSAGVGAFKFYNGTAWVPETSGVGSYLVAALPAGLPNGFIAFATDALDVGESTGAGTGCLVVHKAAGWRAVWSGLAPAV